MADGKENGSLHGCGHDPITPLPAPATVLRHFEPSSPFYGQFSVQKWPFFGGFQDDRPESSGRSPVCQVGVFNEGRSSSVAIGLSKECKRVFNKACTMP